MSSLSPTLSVSPYLTGKHEFAIIPADNVTHRALAIRDLRGQGYHPEIVHGMDAGQPGISLFVPDMPTHAALDFQDHMTNAYGQPRPSSIITKQGLVNVARKTTTPIDFSKTVFGKDAIDKPSHSIVSSGGEDMPFALNPHSTQIPLKAPYEGEHHSDAVIKPGGSVLGSKRGATNDNVQHPTGAEAERLRLGNGAPGGSYFYDKGTLAEPQVAGRKHVYTTGNVEKSIATIESTPMWHDTMVKAFQDAKAKGMQDKEAHYVAANEAEHALMIAGYDGYRSKQYPGTTFLFGDTPVHRHGEENEPPVLSPHPNAPTPITSLASGTASSKSSQKVPAKSTVGQSAKGPVGAPKS